MWRLIIHLLLVFLNFGKSLSTTKPNFILFVTDDQDIVLNGMNPIEKTINHLANQGVTVLNAFASSPICCPSRASILTGMYPHNHATINNTQDGGCYGDFWREYIEPKHTLPVTLNANGYDTFFAGKYLNCYQVNDIPAGWSDWYGLHGNSKYYNYTLTENGVPKKYSDKYFTDYIGELSVNYLEKRLKNDEDENRPFFMMIAPPAPHAPFTPADRHSDKFKNVMAPRTPNFNRPSGELDKHWLLRMKPEILPKSVIDTIDDFYRKRWQTLLAVDELVDLVVTTLEKVNELSNTYIIFTSDNGYHLGQFAQAYDKRQPYETDIRVPFLIRGPNLRPKSILNYPTTLIDLTPTILDFADIQIPENVDGQSIRSHLEELYNADGNDESSSRKEYERLILIEYWGEGNEATYNSDCPWSKRDKLNQCTKDAACHCQDAHNNTYSCLRHFSQTINKIYCQFYDDEDFVEAYDLNLDAYQLMNQGFDWLPSERSKYNILLNELNECVGIKCNIPYV